MLERFKHLAKKSKAVLIIASILWMLMSILLVAPVTVGVTEGLVNGKPDFGEALIVSISNIKNVGENFSKVFTAGYISTFFKIEGYVTLGVFLITLFGLFKSFPKHEYSDIEHRI
jgi:hypothetical protein